MNFGELFTALSQKTMDAQENPLHVIFSAKLYEVQKHLFIWNYSYDPIILCINKKKWDSLNKEEQTLLNNAAKEAFTFQREMVVKQEKELEKKLEKKGMIISKINDATVQKFRKASDPIYKKYREIITEKIFDLFME